MPPRTNTILFLRQDAAQHPEELSTLVNDYASGRASRPSRIRDFCENTLLPQGLVTKETVGEEREGYRATQKCVDIAQPISALTVAFEVRNYLLCSVLTGDKVNNVDHPNYQLVAILSQLGNHEGRPLPEDIFVSPKAYGEFVKALKERKLVYNNGKYELTQEGRALLAWERNVYNFLRKGRDPELTHGVLPEPVQTLEGMQRSVLQTYLAYKAHLQAREVQQKH